MIPTNAQAIIDVRKAGYKPDEMILISTVGKIEEKNHTVFISSRNDYSWSWLHGLQVCVFTRSGFDLTALLSQLVQQSPQYLAIWDVDRKEGAEIWYLPDPKTIDKPRQLWKWKIIANPWCSLQNKIFESHTCS